MPAARGCRTIGPAGLVRRGAPDSQRATLFIRLASRRVAATCARAFDRGGFDLDEPGAAHRPGSGRGCAEEGC